MYIQWKAYTRENKLLLVKKWERRHLNMYLTKEDTHMANEHMKWYSGH